MDDQRSGCAEPPEDVYQALAQHYAVLFPASPPQLGFLSGLLSGVRARSFLDLGCGAGAYTVAVAATGRRALGVDLSPAMVERARDFLRSHQDIRAAHGLPPVGASFVAADMPAGGLIDFHLRMTAPAADNALTGVMPLRPWRRDEVASALLSAGFREIEVLGGFDLRPHDADAPATVYIGRRA